MRSRAQDHVKTTKSSTQRKRTTTFLRNLATMLPKTTLAASESNKNRVAGAFRQIGQFRREGSRKSGAHTTRRVKQAAMQGRKEPRKFVPTRRTAIIPASSRPKEGGR